MSEQKRPDIDLYVETADGYLYGISRGLGFLVSEDGGKNWEQRNTGLPKQVVYPFNGSDIVPFTSLSVDPADEKRIAVTDSWGLYISEDRGETWEQIPIGGPIKSSAYLTSAALSPNDENTILLGTSFSGLFKTADRGRPGFSAKRFPGPSIGVQDFGKKYPVLPSIPENRIPHTLQPGSVTDSIALTWRSRK